MQADRDAERPSRSYSVGASTVRMRFGDILQSKAEVLVSSDDFFLSMGGGVSGAISRAGGSAIALDAAKAVPCQLGDVVVTTAGVLDARHVLHAVTIRPDPESRSNSSTDDRIRLVKSITSRCLGIVDSLGLMSVAFPAIGAGVARIDPDAVALAMAEAIDEHVRHAATAMTVELYLMPKRWQSDLDYVGFFEEFGLRLRGTRATVQMVDPEPSEPVDEAIVRQRQRILDVGRERAEIERMMDDEARSGVAASGQTVDRYLAKTRQLSEELDRRAPVNLFVSYAHDDKEMAHEFIKHLAGLSHAGVAIWSDRMIDPGATWDETIREELEMADAALFLVTASFLSSDYCVGMEWRRAMERRAAGEMALIPVILKACDWKPLVGDLQVLPLEGRPISTWRDFDAACLETVTAIRGRIDSTVGRSDRHLPRSPSG